MDLVVRQANRNAGRIPCRVRMTAHTGSVYRNAEAVVATVGCAIVTGSTVSIAGVDSVMVNRAGRIGCRVVAVRASVAAYSCQS